MFNAVAAQVCKRLDSKDKLFQPPKGWDASDPEGCWMHDFKKGKPMAKTFWMFDTFEEAEVKAAELDWNLIGFDPEVEKWTVEEFDGPRG